MSTTVTQQQILDALQLVPNDRWRDVLHILEHLKSGASAEAPIQTGTDLAGSPLIGIWADRADILDSRAFARQLRERASHRQLTGKSDAAGH